MMIGSCDDLIQLNQLLGDFAQLLAISGEWPPENAMEKSFDIFFKADWATLFHFIWDFWSFSFGIFPSLNSMAHGSRRS